MRWLVKVALSCVFPKTEHLPGIADADLDAFLDIYARQAHPMMRFGVYMAAIAFIFVLPIVTIYVPLPVFLMPAAWRDAHARRAATHRLYLVRQVMLLLKLAGGYCWGADPEVRRRLGLRELRPDPGTFRESF
mgnify:CR=1 FL=1